MLIRACPKTLHRVYPKTLYRACAEMLYRACPIIICKSPSGGHNQPQFVLAVCYIPGN